MKTKFLRLRKYKLLYSLDASSKPSVVKSKCGQALPYVPWEEKFLKEENHWLF